MQTEKSDDIIILHTNDVHCGVQDTIGYDGLMLYKKQLLNKYNNVILVDAGDHIQGGTIGTITNGEAIIEIMNKLEYEVATVGNHEFDYGIPQLETVEKLLDCSYISTNYCYKKNKTSIYPATKIIEKGGKKIGFIGVATPQTLSKTYLINLVDDKGELIYDFLTENHSQELYDKIQQNIDELKKQGCDYIIILGHLGIGGDALEENTSAGVLKNLKNVSALIDGHSHAVYSQTTPDKDGNNIILVQTGTKLANIGVLTIHSNGTLSHKNLDEVPYEADLADQTLNVTRSRTVRYVDKEINELIANITNSYSDKLKEVVGHTDFLLNVFQNASESTETHTQFSLNNENALCNLVTDSMREKGNADASIMNAGTVRIDINPGNITYQDVINTMPFSNDVLVKSITGQNILEALEFGVRTLPGVTTRFPQVSGITYKVDTSINSSVVVDENEVFQSLGKENRVYDVKINGEDLDVNKTYKIASHSFILGGGDGYSMFSNSEILETSIGVDNEVLLDYITKKLNGTIPSTYKTSEGRLIKTNGKINNDIGISLLGFNNYTNSSDMITFNAYYASLENLAFEFPRQLKLEASLNSNSRLRNLEETYNVSCFIQNEVNETKAKYLCEIPGNTSNITNIKINDPSYNNFNVEISPLASNYMNNLEDIKNGEELQNLGNSNIYVLQNASYQKNGNTLLISGQMNNTDISFNNKELTLITKLLPSNNKTEIKCTIDKTTANNCTFNCNLDSNKNYDLDNSILMDDDKLLLINFANGTESEIPNSETTTSNGRRFFKSSKSGLSAGYIVAIVAASVVALALVIGLALFLRKPNVPVPTSTESTVINLKPA